jgi:hypothetical protein
MPARSEARTGMSDHGWGGGWPDDLDPEGGDLGPDVPDLGADTGPGFGSDGADFGLGPDGADFGADLGPDSGSDFGDAETADLGGFDTPDGPDHTPDVPLDPASDSTVDSDPLDGDPLDAGSPDNGPPGDGAPELTPVGADPDLDPNADTWTDQTFPEPLDLNAPEPVDGFPWTDPATLGTAPLPDADAAYQGGPEATELAAYAGEDLPPGTDPWTALSASEDPATSSLARWWSPGT